MSIMDVIAVGAFIIAVVQLVQVRRVATATYEAVRTTAEQLASYNILLLLPELHRIEEECEDAYAAPDRDRLRDGIREWWATASDLRGYLDGQANVPDEFVKLVQRSLVASSRAKVALLDDDADMRASDSARNLMARVCEEGRAIGARMRVHADIGPRPETLGEWLAGNWSRMRRAVKAREEANVG